MDIGKPIRIIEAPAPLDIPDVPEPSPDRVEEPAAAPEPDRNREREPVPA